MLKRQFSRRGFLTLAGATGGGAVLAACVPVEAPVDQQAASDSGEAMPDVELMWIPNETKSLRILAERATRLRFWRAARVKSLGIKLNLH